MSAPKGKGKQLSQAKTSTEIDIPLPPAKDFVPGKISLKDWETLLEIDEGVDAVCEVLEEVVKNASDVIYEKYLTEAAFGYAVQAAKQELLNRIASKIVGRDEGEGDTDVDPTWMEEYEPIPSPIDSWSCGMVPTTTTESLQEPVEYLSPVSIVQLDIPRSAEFRHTDNNNKTESNRELPPRSGTKSIPSVSSRTSKHKPKRSRRPGAGVHRMMAIGRATSDEEDGDELAEGEEQNLRQDTQPSEASVSSPLPDMHAVNHTPFGLKPVQLKWMKEVKYDDKGRIIEMVKLDPTKFPSHRTKPIVSIAKPKVPAYRRKKHGKLKPLSPGRAALLPKPHPPEVATPHSNTSGADTFYVKAHTPKSKEKPIIKVKISGIQDTLGRDQRVGKPSLVGSSREAARKVTVMPSGKGLSSEVTARRFPEVPTVPSLVDSIDPLPGVTVREGGRSVHGPTPISQPPVTPLEGLRPILTPPEVIIGDADETQSAMTTNPHSVAFALSDSSQNYQNRILPARVLS